MKKTYLPVFLLLFFLSSFSTASAAGLVEQNLDYSDHLLDLNNPARGSINHKGFYLSPGKVLNLQTNGTVYSDFMRFLIDLGGFSSNAWQLDENQNKIPRGTSQPLDETSLNNIRLALDSLRNRGGSCVIRTSYDIDCRGSQDPDIDITLTHIKQLANLYRDYEDVIHYVELGMFGTCGEMTSGGQENHVKTLQTFLENSGDNIKVGVRSPQVVALWMGLKDPYNTWYIYPDFKPSSLRFKDSAEARGRYMHRVGLYNDGYLGSNVDLGTYGDHTPNSLSRENAVSWLEEYGIEIPYGGDFVCNYNPEDKPPINTAEFISYEGFRTHTSYADGSLEGKCYNFMDTTIFRGIDPEYSNKVMGNKYIRDHLGYRFVLRHSKIQDSVGIGGELKLSLKIQNVGFGNNLTSKKVSLILKNNESENAITLELPTDIDPTKILSKKLKVKVENPVGTWNGSNFTDLLDDTPEFDGVNELNFSVKLPSEMPLGEWKVYMRISYYGDFKTDNNFHTIQFANDSSYFDKQTRSNYLGKFIVSDKIQSMPHAVSAPKQPLVKYQNGILNVSGANRIQVFDLTGNVVLQKDGVLSAVPLNVPQGVYWVKAWTAAETATMTKIFAGF